MDPHNAVPLVVIGGGQMARALVGGMIAGGRPAESITVIDHSDESIDWWQTNMASVHATTDAAAGQADAAVLLAVKPGVVRSVSESRDFAGQLVVSIAAGVSLGKLQSWIGHGRVVRVMPNTPSLVGAGAAGYAVGPEVTEADGHLIDQMLGAVGLCVRVDESLINAVTAVSGSGPAYVCMIVEAMADGGVAAGLPRAMSQRLAAQTVMGTAKMILQDGRHPGQLKDAVASPGGTTIAAIESLEMSGVRAAMMSAVAAAKRRADEMDQGS